MSDDAESLGPQEMVLQQLSVAIVTTCLILSIISFTLRVYSRLASDAKCWWDDYWMSLVMVLCLAMGAGGYVGIAYGSGVHQDSLSEQTVRTFRKNLFALMLLWVAGVFSVKIGILLFYWRAFTTPRFRLAVIIVAIFTAMTFIANIFSFTFQCFPVATFWKVSDETIRSESCIHQGAMYLASGIINVFGDVLVLFMPLPVVWSLHCSQSRKVQLSLLFLLGSFVCIASIFRLISLTQIVPNDMTHSTVGSGLWSAVEVQIGFICANLPFTRPLLSRCLGHRALKSASPINEKTMGIRRPVLSKIPEHSEPSSIFLTQPKNSTDDCESGPSSSLNLLPLTWTRAPVLIPPKNSHLRTVASDEFFPMASHASVQSSILGGITVRRVVALRVEQSAPGHRAHSFEAHAMSPNDIRSARDSFAFSNFAGRRSSHNTNSAHWSYNILNRGYGRGSRNTFLGGVRSTMGFGRNDSRVQCY